MLSCQQVTELVTDYVEGELSTWQRMRFQMHLGMCGHCRRYLKQMQVTVDSLGHMPAEPIPADVNDELMRRFHDWKNKK